MSKNDANNDDLRKLSKAELALWRAVTKDVDLVDGAEYQRVDHIDEEFTSLMQAENVKPIAVPLVEVAEKGRKARTTIPARDIDKRTEMRLQRGQLDIQGRIDLHGYGQVQAEQALASFLNNAYAQGKRCVLVITGKGLIVMDEAKEDETPGILRRRLPQWVKTAPLDQIVLSIAQASPQHGGAGAYYVLLRRKR